MTNQDNKDNTIETSVDTYTSKAVSGFKWMASTTIVWQLVSWFFTILTARILDPTDYGIFALAETLLPYLLMISVLSIPSWYIQAEKVDKNTEKTIFTFMFLTGSLIAAFGYFIAPFLGEFYGNDEIVLPIKILSLMFIFNAFHKLPMAQLEREFKFKAISLMKLWVGISRVILVYILAVCDFGYWALVIGVCYNQIGLTIWLMCLKGLPPGFGWDKDLIKRVINFGTAATGAEVLHVIFSTADDVLIGKFLGTEALGYYFMAFYIMDMPLAKFNELTRPILFSYFSKIRGYDDELKNIFLNVTKSGLWLIFPILAGMALVADELVLIVFGEKWMPMVIPLVFLSLAGLFRAYTDYIPPLFLALGRPQMELIINVITAIILPLSFLIGVINYGLQGVLWAWILVYPFVCFMRMRGLSQLTIITELMYLKNLKIPFVTTSVMAIGILSMELLIPDNLDIIVVLSMKVVTGILVYMAATYFLFKEEILKAIRLLRQ